MNQNMNDDKGFGFLDRLDELIDLYDSADGDEAHDVEAKCAIEIVDMLREAANMPDTTVLGVLGKSQLRQLLGWEKRMERAEARLAFESRDRKER